MAEAEYIPAEEHAKRVTLPRIRRERFAYFYVKYFGDGVRAVREAGYTTPHPKTTASALLQDDRVRILINQHSETLKLGLGMTNEKLIRHYFESVGLPTAPDEQRAFLGDMIEDDGTFKFPDKWTRTQKRALKKWKVKRTTTTRGEDTIETVELEAELNDPLKGIEFLLRPMIMAMQAELSAKAAVDDSNEGERAKKFLALMHAMDKADGPT